MFKKIFAPIILITLLIFLPIYTVNSISNTQLIAETIFIEQNQNCSVSVNIKQNPGIAAYSLSLTYDSSLLEYIDSNQGALKNGTFYCKSSEKNKLTFVWSASADQIYDCNILSVKFKAKNNMADKTSAISIDSYQLGTAQMQSIKADTINGSVKITDRQNIGDVDCDDSLSITDVVYLNKFIIDSPSYPLTNTSLANADYNKDGIIAANDSSSILKQLAKLN